MAELDEENTKLIDELLSASNSNKDVALAHLKNKMSVFFTKH
jgi:hypothetical protein